jgi:hypothetical protein
VDLVRRSPVEQVPLIVSSSQAIGRWAVTRTSPAGGENPPSQAAENWLTCRRAIFLLGDE